MYRNFIRPRNLCYIPALLSSLVVPYAFGANRVAAMEVRPGSALFTSEAQQAPSIEMELNSLVTEAPKVAKKIKSDVMAAEIALQQIKEQVKPYGLPVPVGENWGPLEQQVQDLQVITKGLICASGSIRGEIYTIVNGQSPDNLINWIRREATKASHAASEREKQTYLKLAREYMESLQNKAIRAAILSTKAEKLAQPENTKANIIKYAEQVEEKAHFTPGIDPSNKKKLLRELEWLDRIVANIYRQEAAPELAKYDQLQQLPTQLILEYI